MYSFQAEAMLNFEGVVSKKFSGFERLFLDGNGESLFLRCFDSTKFKFGQINTLH